MSQDEIAEMLYQMDKAPDWLFHGPTSLGIRFAICDDVAERNLDGSGDLDEMALRAVVETEPKTYLIAAHFTFMSEFGYPYDFWEQRAVQMGENDIPLVRETTDEEDKIIEENSRAIRGEDDEEENLV